MGKRLSWVLLLSGVLFWLPLSAQEPEDTLQEINDWVEAMSQHIAGVRFDEGDVESYLRYWPEFTEIGEQADDTGDDWHELKDLDWILENAEYRAWAASHGLDARDWVLKSMRITMMSMREQMQAHSSAAQGDMAKHMAEIDAQCAQVGPEMCKQMKEAMAATAAMLQSAGSVWEKVPEPTSAEKALLVRYADQLSALFDDEY